MHILFDLLRIKDLYMFRTLVAHPHEALHKRRLVYCVRVVSVGCTRTGLQSWCSTSWGWVSNARNMYRPLILKKNWIKSASCWFHYIDIQLCTVNKTLSITFDGHRKGKCLPTARDFLRRVTLLVLLVLQKSPAHTAAMNSPILRFNLKAEDMGCV
jgi:hypothetical protein